MGEQSLILHYWADLHDAAASAAEEMSRRLGSHVRERFEFLVEHFPREADDAPLTEPPAIRFEGRLGSVSLVGTSRGADVARVTWTLREDLSGITVACVDVGPTGLSPLAVFPRSHQAFPRLATALARRAAVALSWRLDVHRETWRAEAPVG